MDPSIQPGYLPSELTSNDKPLAMETSDVLAHELGHVAVHWGLAAGSKEGVAIAFENDARKARNPNTPTRESYKYRGDLKTKAWRQDAHDSLISVDADRSTRWLQLGSKA